MRQAVEYDLISLGLRLRDAGSKRLSWRDLYVIVNECPPTSAVARHLDPDGYEWGLSQHLQALTVDALQVLAWQNSGKGPPPQPFPRPGVDGYVSLAPEPAVVEDTRDPWDENGTGGVFKGEAVSIDELNAWLGWDTPEPAQEKI